MANLYLDICLSDIPKERMKTARNGKVYLKAIIKPRKEMDKDGYDHYIAAFVPKEEREQGAGPEFIGRAQEKHYDDAPAPRPAPAPAPSNTDDLPF